jgi:hypothetical protein
MCPAPAHLLLGETDPTVLVTMGTGGLDEPVALVREELNDRPGIALARPGVLRYLIIMARFRSLPPCEKSDS